MHEVGFALPERLVVEPQARGGALRHVVVDHIGHVDQAHHHFEPVGILDVDGNVELAALAPDERHADHPHAVPAYGLHLDDLRAQIRQQHRPVGPGQVLPEVEDDHTGQGAHEMSSTIPAPSRRSISAASYPASASTWRLCAPAGGWPP